MSKQKSLEAVNFNRLAEEVRQCQTFWLCRLKFPSEVVSVGEMPGINGFPRVHGGTSLADWCAMPTSHSRQRNGSRGAAADPVCLLRWTFSKGVRSITCQIENDPRGSYDVCVVPHWDVSSTVVEVEQEPIGAFRRHADIARQLRAAGWSLSRRAY